MKETIYKRKESKNEDVDIEINGRFADRCKISPFIDWIKERQQLQTPAPDVIVDQS